MTHAPYPGERITRGVAVTRCRKLVDVVRILSADEFLSYYSRSIAACPKCARALVETIL